VCHGRGVFTGGGRGFILYFAHQFAQQLHVEIEEHNAIVQRKIVLSIGAMTLSEEEGNVLSDIIDVTRPVSGFIC
jgi:hypothetical protein